MAALREDAALLRRAYEELHPGLFRYLTRPQWQANLAALDAELGAAPTAGGAFVAFTRLAATLRCGHSFCNFTNQPRSIARLLFEPVTCVPFHCRWLGERMVVTQNRSTDARLAPGCEILAIDGVPASEMLRRMLPLARADGANDDKRRVQLSIRGLDRYEPFDVFLPLLFPAVQSPFALRVRAVDGSEFAIEVAGLPLASRRLPDAVDPRTDDRPVWQWTAVDAATVVLAMPRWDLYDSKWDWAGWLRARLDELVATGRQNLIVDLRGNEGGLDCGDAILARLVDADLQPRRAQRLVRARKVPDELNPFLDTWDDAFRDWGEAAEPVAAPALVAAAGQTFFRLRPSDDDGGVIRPVAPRFRGRVFVLVGPECSSATFQFALACQQHGLATLVGQPTGGNQRGINGGAFFFLRLPNSRIELDLPLIGTFPDGDAPDAGVVPDVAIAPSVADIAAGVDRELETTLAIIRSPR